MLPLPRGNSAITRIHANGPRSVRRSSRDGPPSSPLSHRLSATHHTGFCSAAAGNLWRRARFTGHGESNRENRHDETRCFGNSGGHHRRYVRTVDRCVRCPGWRGAFWWRGPHGRCRAFRRRRGSFRWRADRRKCRRLARCVYDHRGYGYRNFGYAGFGGWTGYPAYASCYVWTPLGYVNECGYDYNYYW